MTDDMTLLPGWAVDIEPHGRLWLWSVIDEADLVAASGKTLTEGGAHRAARRWIRTRLTRPA